MWDLQEIWDHGIRSIICMGDDSLTDEDLTRYGFEYFDGRLPGSVPPTENDERICRSVLPKAHGFLEKQLSKDEGTILIHCFGGIDRTTFLMIFYLKEKYGIEFEIGLAQLRSVRHNALAAVGWEDMARRILT